MVIGIVIPHETSIAVFEHQFGALADYHAAVGGYDWEKRQGNPWMASQAGFAGQKDLYDVLYTRVYLGVSPGEAVQPE